jgi:hypothetical protein
MIKIETALLSCQVEESVQEQHEIQKAETIKEVE